MSTPAILASGSNPSIPDTQDPEPTLREIFAAITSCNTNLSSLTTEFKGVKIEVALIRQDMQKLRDCTVAMEGRMSTIEDDVAPLQHEVRQVQSLTYSHAARLEDMENRLRRNNVQAVGILEKKQRNESCGAGLWKLLAGKRFLLCLQLRGLIECLGGLHALGNHHGHSCSNYRTLKTVIL